MQMRKMILTQMQKREVLNFHNVVLDFPAKLVGFIVLAKFIRNIRRYK